MTITTKTKMKIGLSISFIVFMIAFQQCAPLPETQDSGSVRLAEVNYFKEPRPEVICGQEGYAFLLRNYIRQNCSACHMEGGLASPAFTALDVGLAYNEANAVNRTRWLYTTTHNTFCGPTCNLSEEGEVYAGLVEWLDHRYVCP